MKLRSLDSEDAAIEQPTVALFSGLDWETLNCYHENFGPLSLLGRETPADVVLPVRLRAAWLCKGATLTEVEAQGWSQNPRRYVGVGERPEDDFDFAERLEELNEELKTLNAKARELEERIATNVTSLLEKALIA